MDKVKGQSINPRGAANLRSIQVILNSKYIEEDVAVGVLDRVRKLKDKDKKPLTDRYIITHALIALGEKYADGVPMPATREEIMVDQIIDSITQTMVELFDKIENGIVQSGFTMDRPQRDTIRQQVAKTVSNAIATDNMVGDSYKWQDDED